MYEIYKKDYNGKDNCPMREDNDVMIVINKNNISYTKLNVVHTIN